MQAGAGVLENRTTGRHSFDIQLAMIGDHFVELLAGGAQRPLEERLCRLTVTVIAKGTSDYLLVRETALYTHSAFRFGPRRRPRPRNTCRPATAVVGSSISFVPDSGVPQAPAQRHQHHFGWSAIR